MKLTNLPWLKPLLLILVIAATTAAAFAVDGDPDGKKKPKPTKPPKPPKGSKLIDPAGNTVTGSPALFDVNF